MQTLGNIKQCIHESPAQFWESNQASGVCEAHYAEYYVQNSFILLAVLWF